MDGGKLCGWVIGDIRRSCTRDECFACERMAAQLLGMMLMFGDTMGHGSVNVQSLSAVHSQGSCKPTMWAGREYQSSDAIF